MQRGDACCVGVAPVKRWLTGGCAAVWFGSGKQIYRRVMRRIRRTNSPYLSVPIRTYPYLSVPTAPPGAAQQTAAAMQNLIAKNYRRVMPLADLPQGNAANFDTRSCLPKPWGRRCQSKCAENSENTENSKKWCAAQSDPRVIAVKG